MGGSRLDQRLIRLHHFMGRFGLPAGGESLDLRVEPLRTSDVSSMVASGNTTETMLTTANTQSFLAEAATAASVLPCRHSFDEKRRPGYVLALAARCAR